jgi:hypothetical protein
MSVVIASVTDAAPEPLREYVREYAVESALPAWRRNNYMNGIRS